MTLHVGLGTFRPVKEEEITDHEMHSEYCMVPGETARIINETRKNGGRVICVGTTSCRTVESFAAEDGTMEESGRLDEHFHLSRLPLQSAGRADHQFPPAGVYADHAGLRPGRPGARAGPPTGRRCGERYRFFSFGDAMLIADFKEQEREKG